jgi:hypothetical protein
MYAWTLFPATPYPIIVYEALEFFFLNTRASYHCIKTKKKWIQCLVTNQMEWTLDGHKPASHLNTTRKINSNMIYSHPTQPKWLFSKCSPQSMLHPTEGACSCCSTSGICPAMRPCGVAELLHERGNSSIVHRTSWGRSQRQRFRPRRPLPTVLRMSMCWQWNSINLAMSLPLVLAWILYLIHWY